MSNSPPRIGYTNKDYTSLLAALLELASEQLPEWTDQSANDIGVMLLELFCYLGDSLFYNQDRIAGESFLETAVERRSLVQLLRLIGYELRPPLAASADLTLLFQRGTTGNVTIPQFAAFKTTAAVTGTPITFQYIQATPITFDRGILPVGIVDAKGTLSVLPSGQAPPSPLPAGSTAYLAYTGLPVVEIDANVTNEVVASSDGSAGQRYALARSPVVDDTLVVTIDEGGGPAKWILVSSLLDSLGTDTSYAVRRDETGAVWVEFGDGTYGKTPQRGLNNITASYCVGGGTKGNVPAYAISKPVTAIDRLKLVVNKDAASGGSDAEGTSDAIVRGPQQFRSMRRAVTAADYEALAKAFGVSKAIAQSVAWNTIQLVVAPAGGGMPSDTLIQDLQAYLEPKRMLTSIIDIVGPTYIEVRIDATVTVLPQFSTGLVQQQVASAVASVLAFDNLTFNQTLYISKLYDVIQDIDGVAGVNITKFVRVPAVSPSTPLPTDGKLVFGVSLPGRTLATGSAPVVPSATGELPLWLGFDGVNSTLTVTGGRS